MFIGRKGVGWRLSFQGSAKAAASESETNDARLKIIG